jgi:hypothetical protein
VGLKVALNQLSINFDMEEKLSMKDPSYSKGKPPHPPRGDLRKTLKYL